jgi:aspartate aminotransferase
MKPSKLVQRLFKNKERLKSQGKRVASGVIKLDKGDPDFPTPEHICHAAEEAIRQGYTHYIPGAGDKELIEAICDELNQNYGCSTLPEGIIITSGAKEAIFLVCAAFLSPGDEILVFTPGYSSYAANATMVGAVPIWVPLTESFTLDPDAVKAAISRKTKAILLCNPNNPTGTSFTRAELEFLAELSLEHKLLLIVDEVYKKLYYDGKSHFCVGAISEIKDRTIIIDSFSKSYAMTGWRLGYVGAAPELARPMYIVHRTAVGSINGPSQRAALAALRGPQECVKSMVAEYDRRRKAIIKKLEAIHGFKCGIPDSTFYFFGRFDADKKSADMVDYLYEKKVAVRSGTEFGYRGEGWIRLSYSIPYKEVIEGIDRLGAALKELQ